ncbi:CTP synthase, partial [Candidatus Saccharibacteria bacterium]
DKLSEFAGFNKTAVDLSSWKQLARRDKTDYARDITIGLVAKYIDNSDTYISIVEALKSASWSQNVDVNIQWINAEKVDQADLQAVDGILVPGGFGARGIDGKIASAEFALGQNKPYLGICLGLQVAVIASARRGGLINAHSTEFEPDTTADVVYIMDGQQGKQSTGGTMRLGDYPAKLKPDSLASKCYGKTEIIERHRHRYEVNQQYLSDIQAGGLEVSGTSPDGKLVEFVEAKDHRFFIATQAHPEFRSRPMRPHPLFVEFVKACK